MTCDAGRLTTTVGEVTAVELGLPPLDLAVPEWCKRGDVGVVPADPVFGTIGAGIDNEGIASAAAVADIRVVVDLGGGAGIAGNEVAEVGLIVLATVGFEVIIHV